ncbi:MAG: ABC transporter substrate-binding protein [Alphaproteobacteria bacterium]|nr:ABC transporter substrate-binding protein [Alphaproteobacteria bacterium]
MADNITSEEAKNWAENKGHEILDIITGDDLYTKMDQIDNIVQNDIDLDYAAKFVMGKYWRQMSEEQKQKYIPLFKRYTKSLYKSYQFDIKKGAVDFSVDKALPTKIGADVYCTVTINTVEKNIDDKYKGGIKVIFLLVKVDNRIKVRDMKIEESSFLHSYRERFYKMVHEDNEDEIDWFLETLEEITNDNEENFD